MLLSWKLSNDTCVLDTAEETNCDLRHVKRYSSVISSDRLTFSNHTQLYLSYAVIIALLTLTGYIMPLYMRLIIIIFNQLIIYWFIPLRKLYPCPCE